METLAQIRARAQDYLDVADTDTFFTKARVDAAINDALIQAADRICATVARQRYMKRVPDISLASGWDGSKLSWTLPDDFRRAFKLKRDATTEITYVQEDRFDFFGANGYTIIGRELMLSPDTNPSGLVVLYFYSPPRISGDSDKPDWIEGYEDFLALKAAARLAVKGQVHDPQVFHAEADRMWPDLLIAARTTPMPSSIRSERGAHMEDWV